MNKNVLALAAAVGMLGLASGGFDAREVERERPRFERPPSAFGAVPQRRVRAPTGKFGAKRRRRLWRALARSRRGVADARAEIDRISKGLEGASCGA